MSISLLGVLGFVPFTFSTIPFQQYKESRSYRHPSHAAVGSLNPPSQFTGGEAKLSISCELRPEITGGALAIRLLEKMAASGQAWPFITGTGQLKGSYVITKLDTDYSELMHDSRARAIQFGMELQKVGEQPFGLKGEAAGLAVGVVRNLIGI